MAVGMAVKTLSQVEVNHWRSNQHEFHGVSALRRIFGLHRRYLRCHFFYLSNSGIRADENISDLTWYDAREGDFTRSSEYRLYYNSYFPQMYAKAGDTMIITLNDDDTVNIYIIAEGTLLANFLMSQLSGSIGNRYSILTDPHELALISDAIANH